MTSETLFDRLRWRDPVSGAALEPVVTARTPAGVPVTGGLRLAGSGWGYPIVDCIARTTPELARLMSDWLRLLELEPPPDSAEFQDETTVESFGFQWSWNSAMRSEADLRWRVAAQFQLDPSFFADKLVLDAGAGAGDQSRWMIERGAHVVSVDLSSAIDIVARKLRLEADWYGVQGDIASLPFEDGQFDVVYCEGVIQHTRDSAATVRELKRMLRPGALVLATHYEKPYRMRGRIKNMFRNALRKRLTHWDRYKLLLLTGNLAALASLPLLGRALRLSGAAMHYDLMPDFKTTWTNTYDFYGGHRFQRHVTSDEFWSYFERAGELQRVYNSGTRVVARYNP